MSSNISRYTRFSGVVEEGADAENFLDTAKEPIGGVNGKTKEPEDCSHTRASVINGVGLLLKWGMIPMNT